MKKLILTLLITLITFACDTISEESADLPDLDESKTSTPLIQPITQLFDTDIRIGKYYFANDLGQALAFSNGVLVCHADFPVNSFQRINIRPNAPNGVYRSKNGFRIGYFEGEISMLLNSFTSPDEADFAFLVANFIQCPDGVGSVVITLRNSPTGRLGDLTELEKKEQEEERLDCMGSQLLFGGNPQPNSRIDSIQLQIRPFDEIFWDTPAGERIDLYCLFTEVEYP